MHQQIRSSTAKSPPDLAAFLQVLANADPPVNIRLAGGSDIELGGEFAFAIEHEDEQQEEVELARIQQILSDAEYSFAVVEPFLCWVDPDEPGALLACILEANAANAGTGKVIRDLSSGKPREEDGMIPVQVYYAEPRSTRPVGS
jgi:hypothetical protein